MEPIILLKHLEQQNIFLRNIGQSFCIQPSWNRVAVIIEPRRHVLLEQIIRNFMFYLGFKWTLHVFTSFENIEWLSEMFPYSWFRITPLDKNNITPDEYSALLMSRDFWNMIHGEYVLIFQTDSILFRAGIDRWVEDLDYQYDYVGANYYKPGDVAPHIGGIQGGLSLRRKSAMLDCIEKVSINHIQSYRVAKCMPPLTVSANRIIAEDIYFTHACEMLKKRVPSVEKRREFSIEADYYPKTLGHHGLQYPYFTEEQQKELISDA